MAAHTKLKFRLASPHSINILFFIPDNISKSQSGQTSVDEVKKRDLRIELLAAEQEARNKKRKAEGLPPLEDSTSVPTPPLDEEASKRRKILQEALELDKDDEEDDEGGDGEANDKVGR